MALISNILPLILILLAIPLGAAGQNIAAGFGGACLIWRAFLTATAKVEPSAANCPTPIAVSSPSGGFVARSCGAWFLGKLASVSSRSDALQHPRGHWDVLHKLQPHLVLSIALVGWIVLVGFWNPLNHRHDAVSFLAGHLFWVLLPVIAAIGCLPLSREDWGRLEVVVALVALAMGTVAITQYLWGWRFDAGAIVIGPKRAQGFYSHPLTFAYVAMLIFPLGLSRILTEPWKWSSYALFLGSLTAIYTSQSRTVQILVAGLILYNICFFARGRVRVVAAALALVAAFAIGFTDNPLRRKMGETISGGHDVRSDYADDRFAFWHAHWEMFRERPFLGHGENLNAEYRAPYYAKIALSQFERQYEAHNMYIQILINGGLIGLGLFLCWMVFWLRQAYRFSQVGFETLVLFCLAGLTQNAFQDFEVRYGLSLVVTAIVLAAPVWNTRSSRAFSSGKFGAIS